MISKSDFIFIMNFILNRQEKEATFSKQIQEFTGDCDFTGFHTNVVDKLVEWLEQVMNDEDNTISWWLWDAPHAGKSDPENFVILDHGKKYVVDTVEALYDYLYQGYSDNFTATAYKAQAEGIKFAIHIIDDLIKDNTNTNNDGVEERNALLGLVREKIKNEYMLASGDDDPAPTQPIATFSIIYKNKDDNE